MRKQQYIILTVLFYREKGDKRWLAECKELGTASYGDTLEDARERIAEAIEIHLDTLEEVGERERFFRKRKIKIVSVLPATDEINIKAPVNPKMFAQPFIHQLARAV